MSSPPQQPTWERRLPRKPTAVQQLPGETQSGLARWLPQDGVLSRGLSLNCSPLTPPQAGLHKSVPQETRLGPGLSLGLRPFHPHTGPGLPPSFLSGRETEGKGKKSSHDMQLGGKPNWDKDGFLGREEMVRERGFAKAELTYLLPGAMHTTTSVCLSVQSPVCAIPNASALPLAACSGSSCLVKPLRH